MPGRPGRPGDRGQGGEGGPPGQPGVPGQPVSWPFLELILPKSRGQFPNFEARRFCKRIFPILVTKNVLQNAVPSFINPHGVFFYLTTFLLQ